MRRFRIVLLVVALTATMTAPVGAQTDGQTDGLDPRPDPESAKRQAADITREAPSPDQEVKVFVQLDVPSVGQFVAAEREKGREPSESEKRSQATRVANQQREVRADLTRFDAEVEFALDFGANGLAILARVGDLLEIADLDGVKTIAPVARHYMTNETSVPFIGAPEVWESSGVGQGISIAIIDSGIDYLHANFGGPGTIEAFEANDPTVIEDGTFPTTKVAGGYDFAGDAYDASSDDPALNTPVEDPDPLDCNGHGSHVAGTAAGNGVDGLLGQGVAPGATLYALKVFGCDGSTDVTSLAIEWAMENQIDVINMSLGSDFGDPNDPTAITTATAVANGIIVVASAGNDGSGIPYVTGSPAVTGAAISVAASHDGGAGVSAIEVTSAPDPAVVGLHEAFEGDLGPALSIVGPISGLLALPQAGNELGCDAIAADLTGRIALIQRGECTFALKAANAEAAGATALVVYNNQGDGLISMGGDGTTNLPSMFVGQSDGTAIAAAAAAGDVSVTMDISVEIPTPELSDTIVDFSSRGPGGGGTTFKPDVSAPGVNIKSTLSGSGDRFVSISGTSMASPHVAGVAALLREQYPDLEVDAIKSLIMNSAVPAQGGEPIVVQGTGVVRANLASNLGAYTSPAGVSFGRVNPVEATSVTREITVHDLDGGSGTYAISVDEIQTAPGVTVSAPSSVDLPSGGSATFEVVLSLDPAAMNSDDGFQSQVDVDGRFHLSGPGGDLVVGYMAAVDPASDVSTVGARTVGRQVAVDISNDSDAIGLVDAFTPIGSALGSVAAVGVRTGDIGGFDVVEFGIAHAAPWESLSARETDIFIDTDEDGDFEYVLVAADIGYLTTGFAQGFVVTALFNLDTGGAVLEYGVFGDNNDHVQVLTTDRFGEFGFLSENDWTFDYLIASFDNRFGLDGLAEGSVDLRRQADNQVNFSGVLAPGEEVTVDLVPANRRTWLVFYANDAVPDQFEMVTLKPQPPAPRPPGR